MARSFSGQRLRDSRKAAGLSVEQLAVTINRSAYSILEYERGRVTPPISVLAAIADAIGQPIEAFLAQQEEAHAA
jgi:transcriptional regulator with XRE-family HTH domain